MKQFIEAGEFVTTHGVMGELKLYPWCDGPEFVAALPRLFFTPEGGRETKVEAVRAHKGMCLVKLKGVDSIDAARWHIFPARTLNCRRDAILCRTLWAAR